MAATTNTMKSPVNPRTGRVSKAESLVVEAQPVIEITPGALSSPNAAQYVGLNNRTLANMRAQGRGPRFFRAGGQKSRVYCLMKDLDASLEERAAATNGGA